MRDRKSVLDVAQVVADVVTELLQRCTAKVSMGSLDEMGGATRCRQAFLHH